MIADTRARLRTTFALGVLGIVLAGAVVRVVYTVHFAPWPPGILDDQFFFSAIGPIIAHGHGFVRPADFAFHHVSVTTAEHPPLYPVVLAGLAKLGGSGDEAQRLAGTVFGSGTVVCIALLGRRFAGERAGLIAAALAAFYPTLVAADGALMSESLYGLLIALSLIAALRLIEAPGPGRAAVLGALIGLAAQTRSEALLLLVPLPLPLLRRPGGLRAAGAVLATAVVVLAPWTIRTWSAFDRPVLIATDSGSAIGGANCPATYAGASLGSWQLTCVRLGRGNEARAYAHARTEGVRYARHHAGRLPVVALARLGRAWSLYKPFPASAEGRDKRLQGAGVAEFYVLVLLGAFGLLALRRRNVPAGTLLVPFVLVTVTAITVYGNLRFRQPAEVALVVLAAVGVDALLRSRRDRTRSNAPTSATAASTQVDGSAA